MEVVWSRYRNQDKKELDNKVQAYYDKRKEEAIKNDLLNLAEKFPKKDK